MVRFHKLRMSSSSQFNREKYAIVYWDDFTLSVMCTSQLKFIDDTGLLVEKHWPGYGICRGTIREKSGKS